MNHASMASPLLAAHASLGLPGALALVFTAFVFALFVWDRLPITTVCLGILVLLPLGFTLLPPPASGPVDIGLFFEGFGHPALIAICALMIVGQALVITGALEPAARRLSGWAAARPRLALLAVLLMSMVVSGVINDTPLVVLLIPFILAAASRAGTAAPLMLLPMNYAVLIGGMATTIGTSTNLIVVALAAGLGVGGFSLFSFFPLVATAALPALAYLWLVAPRLLAHVQPPAEELSEQVFDAELQVESASWLEGRELREAFAATGGRMRLVDVRRDDRSPARLPSLVLRAGDRLLLQDTTRGLKDIEASLHATLHGLHSDPGERSARGEAADGADAAPVDADAATAPVSVMVVQMIVTPGSPLVGRSVRQQRLAERYDTAVVGLRPREVHEGWQRENLADRAVHAGDILLLQGDEKSIRLVQRDGFGLLLDARYAVPRQSKAALALATMAAVVLLAATQTLPIALAALAGVLFLIATRCLSWQDVTQSLSAKVVLLVAASLALGQALEITHATAWLGQQLAVLASGLRPAWVLVLLMGLMGLLTNFVSNNAAAAIGTPLGVALARSLGVAPEPFVLAVLFGCNLSYLTPMGYQTNLLVMNAGGYRFSDFLRVGTPLFLIMWAGLSYGLMLRYGL